MPQFSAAARHRLETHLWPGNVRELRNLMERLAYFRPSDDRGRRPGLRPLAAGRNAPCESKGQPLAEATDHFQIEHIRRAIRRAGGNMSEAAQQLGLHRSNLYRKMRQLGMSVPS